jgi:outer membrane protein assembly factor BamD
MPGASNQDTGEFRGTGAQRRWPLRRWAMGLAVAAVTALVVPAAGGCATGPDLSADYGQTARENYELAVGEYIDKDWEEVIAYADFVRIRFPFSRYAVESELLICRAQFELGEYILAEDAFKQFSRLHPTHRHVRNGWVPYMSAVSAYMASPESWFILPPHYQRDQTLLQDALIELAYFFDHYSHTKMAPLARELEATVQRKLLEHELYVARFYLDRERPEAAIGRLESAHDTYPGIGLDAEVLFLLGVTYLRVDEIELARNTFSELQTQHPTHYHGAQAKLYRRHIQTEYGPADPNRARPERPLPQPEIPPRPKKPETGKKKGAKGKRGQGNEKRVTTG